LQEYLTHTFEINIVSQRKLSDGSFKNEYHLLAKSKISEKDVFNQLTSITGVKELKVVRKKIASQL
jgi:hypothetical protein